MVMKRKLGLELYGPCSNTGAVPKIDDMVAKIHDDDRISFHQIQELDRVTHTLFVIRTQDNVVLKSDQCYLLYGAPSVSKLKNAVRRLKNLIN